MKYFTLPVAIYLGLMSGAAFSSANDGVPAQNPLCPKKMTEEIYKKLETHTYPGIKVKKNLSGNGFFGMRHGSPGFKWDVEGLTLIQGDLRGLGGKLEELSKNCLYVEKGKEKTNFILFAIE